MKQKALLYGYGDIYKKNICWIRQLYNIVGITDAKITVSCVEEQLYTVEDAVKLDFEVVLVTCSFIDEVRRRLVDEYGIGDSKISYFLDEFSTERHESFGEKNPNVTFYIFRARWQEHDGGFYNFFIKVFAACYEVKKQGFELLVDMKNYYTEYAGLERYGVVNVWEDYYRQPSMYTLEEAYQSQNVILSNFDEEKYNRPCLISREGVTETYWYVETYKKMSKMFNFMLGSILQKQVCDEEQRLRFLDKALGVLARGTDYTSLKPKMHAIPVDTISLIAECKKRLIEGGYSYIYLATEDLDILEEFKKSFGERLLYSQQMRIRQNVDRPIMRIKFNRENDAYLRGLEYCTVIEILARCRGLLANCCCAGTLGAIAVNGGKYSSCEVFDIGRYS